MCVDMDDDVNNDDSGPGCFNPMPIIIIMMILIMIFQSCEKRQYDPVRNFHQYMIEWRENCNKLEKENKE